MREYKSSLELARASVTVRKEETDGVYTIKVLSEVSLWEMTSILDELSYRLTLTSDTSCPSSTTKVATTQEEKEAKVWFTKCVDGLLFKGSCDFDSIVRGE